MVQAVAPVGFVTISTNATMMQVASAGLRAAQPEHRLLFRQTRAGDGRLALEPRRPQRIQGPPATGKL